MFLSPEEVAAAERRYGVPRTVHAHVRMTRREIDFLRSTQRGGRSHDITPIILHRGRIVVISKPGYPPGAYRPPSGGVPPGEALEVGTLREALEETGATIALDRYLLRSDVTFQCGRRRIPWTTHVFSAHYLGGPLEPRDRREIAEVRLATLDELRTSIRAALLASGSAGLRYRALLFDWIAEELLRGPEEAALAL